MFCMNCGTQLPDGSRFCSSCGAPQQADAAPTFQQPAYQQPVYQQPAYQQPAYAQPVGAMLLDAGKVTRYNGGKTVGTVTGTGDLVIYDNRVEFNKKSGDQRGYMLGPIVGAALAMNDAKKNPVDVYDFYDIKSVRKGKYAGLKETVVLEFRNGKAISFVPASKKANPDQIVALITPYLR